MARRLPKILKATAAHLRRRSRGQLDKAASFAVATSALQGAGILRKGTNRLTKRGRRVRPS